MIILTMTALVFAQTPDEIASSLDCDDEKRLDRHYPKTLDRIEKNEPLTIQDIKNMTRSGVSDDSIIEEINASRSIFYLTPDDEKELQQAGVSQRVLRYMQDTSKSVNEKFP